MRLVLLLWLSLYTNWCTTQQLRWDGDAIDCVCCLIWNSVDSDSVWILIVCCTCISTTDVNIDNQMRQHYNTNDVYSPREDEVYLQRKEGIPGSPRRAYVCVLGREANIQIFEQSWYICWFRWIGGLHCNVSHIIRILRMCRVQTHVKYVRRGMDKARFIRKRENGTAEPVGVVDLTISTIKNKFTQTHWMTNVLWNCIVFTYHTKYPWHLYPISYPTCILILAVLFPLRLNIQYYTVWCRYLSFID